MSQHYHVVWFNMHVVWFNTAMCTLTHTSSFSLAMRGFCFQRHANHHSFPLSSSFLGPLALFPPSASTPGVDQLGQRGNSSTPVAPPTLTGRGVSLDRECLHCVRSTRWSGRCAPTWSGNSMSIPLCFAIFKVVSNMTLLALDPICRPFSCNRHWHPSRTKVG